MRTCTVVLILALALAAFGQTPAQAPNQAPVSKAGISALMPQDRLQIRDVQLALAQAHITRLQTENQIKTFEQQLGQIIEELKAQYSCPGCTLNQDFTWTKPEPPKAPKSTPPAPSKDGQTSTKE